MSEALPLELSFLASVAALSKTSTDTFAVLVGDPKMYSWGENFRNILTLEFDIYHNLFGVVAFPKGFAYCVSCAL